jgi:hypothetical protein
MRTAAAPDGGMIAGVEEHDHRAGPSRAGLVFAGLPVALAVGAGAIYAAGAVTTLASLLRSGTGAEEVFVQIPIEQHLAHGLEYVVHPETCAALFVTLLVFAWEMQDRPSITAALARASPHKEPAPRSSPPPSRALGRIRAGLNAKPGPGSHEGRPPGSHA